MKMLALCLAAVLLAGCAGFKLGAMCYLPAGMSGACTIEPAVKP